MGRGRHNTKATDCGDPVEHLPQCADSVQFSSVRDDFYALGKALMCSTPSLRSFPNVAFETVPMFVSLMMALSHPFEEDRLALRLSAPLSSRRPFV